MLININEEQKQFHLTNGKISYIFHVMKNGQLGHLYYGKALSHREDFSYFQSYDIPTPNTTHPYADDASFSLETSKQEYPSFGTTDFREPAIHMGQQNGSYISNFTYSTFKHSKGKPRLQGLPATYVMHEDEAETLEIVLMDDVLETELILSYTIFKEYPVITRHASIKNNGETAHFMERMMSSSIDFPHSNFEMLQLSGAWSRERQVKTRVLESGIQSISSLRGASSHHQNPFLALKDPQTTEFNGEVYGFSLVYSSNFLAQIEVDHYDNARVSLGIHPFGFKWKLEPNETFQTPEVVLVYSDQGLNGMSQVYHDIYRDHLVRGKWKNQDRPVMLNNWEATYFDFNENKILDIAREGKSLGIELFVLDDGWFGKRNDDTTSLGDWFVDKSKLPNGIGNLSKEIREMGLDFGLWFEPEMVNEESNLAKQHPDWVIQTPNREISYGRNQWVLDFSRPEIVDYLYERMASIINETELTYIKWDMNRNITEAYSASLAADRQGEFYHRYILGVYQLYERLTAQFPQVLFESCAGGGGRFDPGMLYYAPQTWTSDNTDAMERLKIQYGTSFVYPLSSIGTHVSDIPNHQTGRNTPLNIRANVAYFGTFGYELNPLKLSDEDKEEIKKQMKFFKRNRSLIRTGEFIRLKNPNTSNEAAWMVVSEDKSEALVGYYKILASSNPAKNQVLRLKGLDADKIYNCENLEVTFYGDELINRGLPLSTEYNGSNPESAVRRGDFQTEIFYLSEKKGE